MQGVRKLHRGKVFIAALALPTLRVQLGLKCVFRSALRPQFAKCVVGRSPWRSHSQMASAVVSHPEQDTRVFIVQMMGGSSYEVSVPHDCNVERLLRDVAHAGGMGASFHLVAEDGSMLDNPSTPLPMGTQLTVVLEDLSRLCPAAQRVLRETQPVEGRGTPEELALFRLGKCGRRGTFPTNEWMEDPRMPYFVQSLHAKLAAKYHVFELTLVDGENQHKRLIGVINEGDADVNTGFWGAIYLLPELQEVGGIVHVGDTESRWELVSSSWYADPEPPLQRGNSELLGGKNAETPLETHLARALEIAYYGKADTQLSRDDESICDDESSCDD